MNLAHAFYFSIVFVSFILLYPKETTCAPVDKCGISKISVVENKGRPLKPGVLPVQTRILPGIQFPYVQSRNNRIVGGTEARPHSWPWMAALVRGNFYICGAVLIDERHALTAAHCVVDRPSPSAYRVILGAHNIYQGEVYNVNGLVYHPLFDKGLPPRGHDIAILRLSQNANMTSPYIGVVCMPTFYLTGAGGRECVVTGWGRLSEGGPPTPKLQEVKVPILDNHVCNDRNHYGGLVDSTMLCAGWEEGGKDTCQGDSGGPLVCQVNGQWQLHGLVSWGYGCARAGKPGVYARVSVLQSWITAQAAILRRKDITV